MAVTSNSQGVQQKIAIPEERYIYEIGFAGSQFMSLPTLRSLNTYIQFDALIPDDDGVAESAFAFYGPSNIPRLSLKFKPSSNIMQMQGVCDNGTTDIDEDTAVYTQWGVYATIKVEFSGTSLVLSVNGSPFHTFAHGNSITPQLWTTNFIGANDAAGNLSLRDGCKIKNIYGVFGTGLAYTDVEHSVRCDPSDPIASLYDTRSYGYWFQSVLAKRPTVIAITNYD